MGNEPLKVSDPSQKWKFVVCAVVVLVLVAGYLDLRNLLLNKAENKKFGFNPIISLTSTSTAAIVGTSSTLITATSTGPHFICNTGLNDLFVAFASSISTSSVNISRGMHFPAGNATSSGVLCQGPFDYIGVHAAHTNIGTTSLTITVFP